MTKTQIISIVLEMFNDPMLSSDNKAKARTFGQKASRCVWTAQDGRQFAAFVAAWKDNRV